MSELIVAVLVALNAGYVFYLHRRLQRLAEVNRAQAAADRRLIVTALEVGGELRGLTDDLKKQGEMASKQYEKLILFLTKIAKHQMSVDLSEGNVNGRRPKGQAVGARPGNGTGRRAHPDAYV